MNIILNKKEIANNKINKIKHIRKQQKRTTWSDEEISILKENFPNYTSKKELILKLPLKSWNAILNMARGKLKLKKTNRWEYQKERDKKISSYFSKNEIDIKIAAKIFNMPEDLLYKKMKNMGIKPCGKKVTNNLKVLLNESAISSYWLGFILADGSFPKHKNKNGTECCHLSFWLSKKDEIQVREFAKYIGITNIREQIKINAIGFTANDIKTIRQMFIYLGLDDKIAKTYSPPTKLFDIQDDLLFSLLVGYIDGDGCIKKIHKNDKQIMTVTAHLSWINLYDRFDSFLYSYFNVPRESKAKPSIISNGYSLWTIRNTILLKKIKEKAISMNLPIMNRKWDRVY